MSEASRWPLPSPPSEPVLTLVLAADAAGASAWTNRLVVGQAESEPKHLCAFWTPDPTTRRSALGATETWVDQRFSFHRTHPEQRKQPFDAS